MIGVLMVRHDGKILVRIGGSFHHIRYRQAIMPTARISTEETEGFKRYEPTNCSSNNLCDARFISTFIYDCCSGNTFSNRCVEDRLKNKIIIKAEAEFYHKKHRRARATKKFSEPKVFEQFIVEQENDDQNVNKAVEETKWGFYRCKL